MPIARARKKDFGTYFWIHSFLILAAYSSPLWVDWKIILLAELAIRAQFLILGTCILTQAEMSKRNQGFIFYYIRKLFPSIQHRTVEFVFHMLIPIILIVSAFVLQELCGDVPILKI